MIFERLLLLTGFVGVIMALQDVIGTSVYDLGQAREQRQRRQHPYAAKYRKRPLISVIVLTHNSENVIERCLDSLLQSSYRKWEIIIIDNASKDATKSIVKQFIVRHPKRAIKLGAKRQPVEQSEAALRAYKKYAKGELILVLDAGCSVDKEALSMAVRHFNIEPRIGILTLNFKVIANYSVIGILQKFEHLLRYRAKKFSSVSNSEYMESYEGAICTRNAFNMLAGKSPTKTQQNADMTAIAVPNVMHGNRHVLSCYASNAIVYTEPLPSFWAFLKQRYTLQLSRCLALKSQRKLFFSRSPDYSKFLTWFRLPFSAVIGLTALIVPILVSYFLYLALRLHQPAFFMVTLTLLSIFMVFAVFEDEQLKFRQKVAYSALIPVTYSVFYILSFIQYFVILGAALPRNKLSNQR